MSIWFDEAEAVETAEAPAMSEGRETWDVTRMEGGQQLAAAARVIQSMAEQMARMAAATEEIRQRMAELEKAVRTLEKVTPAQGAEINRRIRTRAAEICGDWGLKGSQKLVAGWIRRAVRDKTGVRTSREVPRCDFGAVCGMIEAWEDVSLIRKARDAERVQR